MKAIIQREETEVYLIRGIKHFGKVREIPAKYVKRWVRAQRLWTRAQQQMRAAFYNL